MNSYQEVMARKSEIMRSSVGIDYGKYARGRLAFDYEGMLADTGYAIDDIRRIQRQVAVGNTPLVELKNLSAIARSLARPGMGARIFVKDEAANPSGSYKDRRASMSAYEACRLGYPGIAAASSGNYGAAVASQACKYGLGSIIVQESFDSRGIEQPEIAEKTRACESYGAEVLRLSVGPELFYQFLLALEETGYYNASLYTPQAILGVESLGWEIVEQVEELTGKRPHTVIATNAGGGNLTGTARGLKAAGAEECSIVGASVDLQGLHMASDRDFNRKSFTTGHTGFSIPFTTWPDRSDVPRSAARPLRYMDRFVTVSQGEVFYMTQALAEMEGMERGPAGNTSLAAAFAMAQQIPEDEILVVQETEYTGAGKHPIAQLNLAKSMGIEVYRGNPEENLPGRRIVIPADPRQIQVRDIPISRLQHSYLKHALEGTDINTAGRELETQDIDFLMAETRLDQAGLMDALEIISHE
ncbi:2-amino-4-oxopentanoate thiolase subunit OrtB [Salinispira pacifica]|uniref:2-amino-4-ketopentanoate thiolase, beta subunit n=1 Tax=Salinispira pacifica TaxID=1307761 RepID=V5WF48_9SPIO|nr:2-amino-4-oxopentanoate thiolase subunit OrtB [Salinispira pacifica]AHC14428.1 2-amino-4-ketopentanoate thiolase, beta subunit [Salinispira pacifica]